MVPQRSVLIVDPAEETREVLRTALEQRGLKTFAASRAAQGWHLARQHQPGCIVVDLEIDGGERVARGFARQSGHDGSQLVLLGRARRAVDGAGGEFVAKPYHYGPLIRKIEALLSP